MGSHHEGSGEEKEEIVGNRLRIVPLKESDAESLFAFYSDAEAMKYRGSAAMLSIDDAARMIETAERIESGVRKQRLAIRIYTSDLLVGTLLLQFPLAQPEQCEIGFSFGKAHWGKGYAQETLQVMESELARKTDIRILTAWCRRENLASVHLFRKTGYEEVRQNDYPESLLFRKNLADL